MAIKYFDIELAFEFVSSQPRFMNSAYISKVTGDTYFVSDLGDSDELPDDIDDPDKYIALPHKNDLDLGIALVRDFAWQRIPDQAEQVERLMRGRGAYGRLKDFLERLDLLDEWYRFEEAKTQAALKRWCAEQGIEYVQ